MKKEYKEYSRIQWPYYQELMEEHHEEWSTEVAFLDNDVIVPSDWISDHETKIIKDKEKLIELELIEYFKKTYIKKFYLGSDWGDNQITIYPTKPRFDEDYSGEFDDDVEEIGKKYDVDLQFDDGIYGK